MRAATAVLLLLPLLPGHAQGPTPGPAAIPPPAASLMKTEAAGWKAPAVTRGPKRPVPAARAAGQAAALSVLQRPRGRKPG